MPDRTQPERQTERHDAVSRHAAASAQASNHMLSEVNADQMSRARQSLQRSNDHFRGNYAGTSEAERRNWSHLNTASSVFDGDYSVQPGDTATSIVRRDVQRHGSPWNEEAEQYRINGMTDRYGEVLLPGLHIDLRAESEW